MSDVGQVIEAKTGFPEIHLPIAVPKSAQQLADHIAPFVNLVPHETRIAYLMAFIGAVMGMFLHPKK